MYLISILVAFPPFKQRKWNLSIPVYNLHIFLYQKWHQVRAKGADSIDFSIFPKACLICKFLDFNPGFWLSLMKQDSGKQYFKVKSPRWLSHSGKSENTCSRVTSVWAAQWNHLGSYEQYWCLGPALRDPAAADLWCSLDAWIFKSSRSNSNIQPRWELLLSGVFQRVDNGVPTSRSIWGPC